jgi:SsrA-binding protein
MAKTKQAAARAGGDEVRVLVRNRRALHDYEISDCVEAGMVLVGSEVKSLRESQASLGEGHIEIRHGEAWLVGAQINEYPWANQFNHDPKRPRKLLLHRDEIARLDIKASQRGFTLVPLSIYLKGGRIKLEIGVGRGKKKFEKRESKKEAEATREIEQAMRRRR